MHSSRAGTSCVAVNGDGLPGNEVGLAMPERGGKRRVVGRSAAEPGADLGEAVAGARMCPTGRRCGRRGDGATATRREGLVAFWASVLPAADRAGIGEVRVDQPGVNGPARRGTGLGGWQRRQRWRCGTRVRRRRLRRPPARPYLPWRRYCRERGWSGAAGPGVAGVVTGRRSWHAGRRDVTCAGMPHPPGW